MVVVQEFRHPVAPLDQIQYLMRLLQLGEVLGEAMPRTTPVGRAALVVAVFGMVAQAAQAIRHLHHPHKVTTVELDHLLGQSTVVAAAAERLLLEPQDQEALEEMAAAVRHLQSQELL